MDRSGLNCEARGGDGGEGDGGEGEWEKSVCIQMEHREERGEMTENGGRGGRVVGRFVA